MVTNINAKLSQLPRRMQSNDSLKQTHLTCMQMPAAENMQL